MKNKTMQNHNDISHHHAHLLISDHITLTTHIVTQLQKILCPKSDGPHGCQTCNVCLQIKQKQHPWVTWIEPENSYNLEDIDQVIEAVRFMLDTNEKRFFIFTNSQELTPACSNRLLKTIEEPHHGYFFIFLANKADDILPTLTSRCFIKQFMPQHYNHDYQDIMQYFLQSSHIDPVGLIKNIERLNIKESQTKEILDLLLQHFHAQLTSLHNKNHTFDAEKMLAITDKIILIKQAMLQPPLAGSSKLFWKNLYVTFNHHV